MTFNKENSSENYFQYDVLDVNMIRLFKLDLSNENEPLSGQLMSTYHNHNHLDLSLNAFKHLHKHDLGQIIRKVGDGSGYDTFSYAWGSLHQSHALHLSVLSDTLGHNDQVKSNYEPYRNGKVMIGDNLHHLLMELRRRKHNRFVWIDAICINQANEAEKSMQLPMMRDIYEYAEQGYIWLGSATASELFALKMLPDLTTSLAKLSPGFSRQRTSKLDNFQSAGLPAPSDEVWQNLNSLIKRPYWSRLWCLQEVVVGKVEKSSDTEQIPGVLVMCGPATIPFSIFDNFALVMARCGLKSWLVSGEERFLTNSLYGFDGLDEIRVCRSSWNQYGWAVSLGALLLGTRRRLASVPKDMVLGMLALLDGHTARSLALDISQSTEAIFIKFAKHYIRNDPKEVLLNHIATEDKLEGLPSWCPNFASIPSTTSLGTKWLGASIALTVYKQQMYCAGFTKNGKWDIPRSRLYYLKYIANSIVGRHSLDDVYDTKNPRQMYFTPGSDTVIAMGMHLDEIVAVVDCNAAATAKDFFSLENLQVTKDWLDRCLQLSKQHLPTGVPGFDILSRTVVANRVMMEPFDDEDIVFDREEQLDLVSRYFSFTKFIDRVVAGHESPLALDNLELEVVRYIEVMAAITKNRCFFATKHGRVGLGPANAKAGDAVCVLFYCPTPYVLRHQPNGKSRLVGEAYVHGLMYGEALNMLERGEVVETKWAID